MSLADLEYNEIAQAAFDRAATSGAPILLPAYNSDRVLVDNHGSPINDASIGVEATVRFTWATGDLDHPYITANATYYVTARIQYADDTLSDPLDHLDLDEATTGIANVNEDDVLHGAEIIYAWEVNTEFISHADATNPDGTLIEVKHESGDGSPIFFKTLDHANEVATEQAHAEEARNYSPANILKSIKG